MADNSAKVLLEMQKLTNNTQVQLQKMSDASTAKTFDYNTKEAKASRDWQTQMSNTAHQREVADLKKAGLNPILSANDGAQSYTTSSANAQAENPANAIASVTASRMSGMAGIQSSEISASATRAAAAQQAAATRAAAAASASAAKYAASMNYLASKERNEANERINKYAWDTKQKIEFNKPTGNPLKMIDKYFGSSSGMQNRETLLTRLKSVVSSSGNISKNPSQYFYTPKSGALSKNNFVLNTTGIRTVRNKLTSLGMPATTRNINLYTKAFVFNDTASMKSFTSMYKAKKATYAPIKQRVSTVSVKPNKYSWKSSI